MVLLAATRLKPHCSSCLWTSCLFLAVPAAILLEREAQPGAFSSGSSCLENTLRIPVSLLRPPGFLCLSQQSCVCRPLQVPGAWLGLCVAGTVKIIVAVIGFEKWRKIAGVWPLNVVMGLQWNNPGVCYLLGVSVGTCTHCAGEEQ